MRKWIALLLTFVLLLALTACGQDNGRSEPGSDAPAAGSEPAGDGGEAPAGTGNAGIHIAVVDKSYMHQFHQTLKLGCEQAAGELGITLSYDAPENATWIDRQLEMIEAAIDKRPDALCIAALDGEAVVSAVQRASDLGIPVICFDNGINSDIPLTTVATNDLAATAVLADKMAEAIGGSGRIAVLGHDQTSKNGIERRDGFVDAIAANYPEIEIVEIQYAMDQLKATDVAKAMLSTNALDGIYGTNESTVIGILNAVDELGLDGQVKILGYDSGQQQVEAIRSGKQYGAITQNPVGIGYDAVMNACAAIRGEELPAVVDATFFYYDASNIDDPEIAICLYD